MIEAKTIEAKEEKELLEEWFATVEFDKPSKGIPKLEDEPDDEERARTFSMLESADMDELLKELRKRDPNNPF